MEGRFYRTVGLSLRTWRQIEAAKSSRLSREVLGKYATDSQTIEWLINLGMGAMEKLESQTETIQEALR